GGFDGIFIIIASIVTDKLKIHLPFSRLATFYFFQYFYLGQVCANTGSASDLLVIALPDFENRAGMNIRYRVFPSLDVIFVIENLRVLAMFLNS
ncbi:MAG: hypothetical protein RR719_09300, partial [Akkermansia sp.]